MEIEVSDPKFLKFLKKSGIDFEELRSNGINIFFFSNMFARVLSRHSDLEWVTFHGLFDLPTWCSWLARNRCPYLFWISMILLPRYLAAVC